MKKFNEHIENEPTIPKLGSGYSVPDGYFEAFGGRLEKRLKQDAELKSIGNTPPRAILKYLQPAMGLAAGLAILLTVFIPRNEPDSRLNLVAEITTDSLKMDSQEHIQSVLTYLVTDGQFFSALTDMEEYDASKISKDVLVDYLASNCSDFEILDVNK